MDDADQLNSDDFLRARFLSYIFHELRNPLTVIHSYAQILQTRLPNTPEFSSQRRVSEQMVAQGEELVAMFEELLEAARIPLNRLRLDTIECNLIELLDNFVEGLSQIDRERLDWQLPTIIVPVLAEAPRLERAIKSIVSFVLQVCKRTKFELSCDKANVWLSLATPDWVISDEQAASLFDMYRAIRQDSFDESLKAGKLDISLFVARGIIESHGGTLTYESSPPSFVISLPLASN